MKTKVFKIVSLLLALTVVLACVTLPASASKKVPLKVTVLGDSVAYGSYVIELGQKRFSDALEDTLKSDGYDAECINYAIPKYSTASIWYDLNEETYNYDNDRFVAELGAVDYRDGISYNDFISTLESSDVIVIHAGENDLAASFYKMRGYDDYYIFYGNERNLPLVQNDINNRKIGWIYTLNQKKIEAVENEFEKTIETNLDKSIKRIKEINPNAQIIVCNMFDPYQEAADGLDYTLYLIKDVIEKIADLPKSKSIQEIAEKMAGISTEYETLKYLLSIMLPALAGTDMDNCGGFDISNLYTFEKILYKIQYLRVEKASVDMYKRSVNVFEKVVADNNVSIARLTATKEPVYKHLAYDGVHPNEEGHAIIANEIYNTIDFSKLSSQDD